jgi:hypothetical protein
VPNLNAKTDSLIAQAKALVAAADAERPAYFHTFIETGDKALAELRRLPGLTVEAADALEQYLSECLDEMERDHERAAARGEETYPYSKLIMPYWLVELLEAIPADLRTPAALAVTDAAGVVGGVSAGSSMRSLLWELVWGYWWLPEGVSEGAWRAYLAPFLAESRGVVGSVRANWPCPCGLRLPAKNVMGVPLYFQACPHCGLPCPETASPFGDGRPDDRELEVRRQAARLTRERLTALEAAAAAVRAEGQDVDVLTELEIEARRQGLEELADGLEWVEQRRRRADKRAEADARWRERNQGVRP